MTDAELVRRAKAGELPAFEELVSRYERRVYSLAWRMLRNPHDAEDVTQQTFISALEHRADFREQSSFYSWLMRIASHAALKVIRKRRGLPTDSRNKTRPGNSSKKPSPNWTKNTGWCFCCAPGWRCASGSPAPSAMKPDAPQPATRQPGDEPRPDPWNAQRRGGRAGSPRAAGSPWTTSANRSRRIKPPGPKGCRSGSATGRFGRGQRAGGN